MKISKKTLEVLKNFSSINPSILFREGSVISTIAPSKKIVAYATVEESFGKSFGIYELSKLIGALSMMKDPDLEIGESCLTVSSEGRTLDFVYSAPETIISPPEKEIILPEPDVTFLLPARSLAEVLKAASILGVNDVRFSGNGEKITVRAVDVKNPSSHGFSVDLGPSPVAFSMTFKAEAFRFIPGDYSVQASLKKIAKFSGDGVTYMVAAEAAEGK